MTKISTEDCKAFLADYKDTDFLKLLKRWSWKSPKAGEWVRLSKYKDKQGRVARDFTNKAAPLLVTLVEGPNGLEISRERAIGPWEKLWTGKLVEWQQKRSLPDCDNYVQYCVYGSAMPEDFQFGVVPGVYSGEGLEHVFFFQPLAIRVGEVWDQHMPIDKVIKNAGGTLEEGAGELQEATWEFITPTDHMKAQLIQWGFVHNPTMDVEGVPVVDRQHDPDYDLDGAQRFGGSMPSDFTFGIVEDNGADCTVFIRPNAVPDWDQDIPLDRIVRNGGGVLPQGSGESMECSWYIPEDVANVKARLTKIGMVYDPKLDEGADEDDDEDEDEDDEDPYDKMVKQPPSDFEFGCEMQKDLSGQIVPHFFFQPVGTRGWDRGVPVDDIAANAGHSLPRRADEVSECLWTIPCADWKAGRDLLVSIGFVYNPDLNNINAGGEFPLEGLDDEEEEDEDDDSPAAIFAKSLPGRALNEFKFGIIWKQPSWAFYFHIQGPNGYTWDGHFPLDEIVAAVGKSAELQALGPGQIQENIYIFDTDVELTRRALIDMGFVYDPAFNDPFKVGTIYPGEYAPATNTATTQWVAEMKLPEYGSPEVTFEDAGQAAYVEIGEGDAQITGSDRCFFVRLHSWDDDGAVARGQPRPAPGSHKKFMSLLGKKVRVTIEVIDE